MDERYKKYIYAEDELSKMYTRGLITFAYYVNTVHQEMYERYDIDFETQMKLLEETEWKLKR